MKKWIVCLTVVAAAALPLSAMAVGRMADITITDRSTGASLPVVYHRGEYWVAGVPGAKYAVAIRNSLGERLLAVASVDGVNVLSGDTASTGQSGYVFGAWQRYEITGWRKSNSEVAAFEFTASHNSYAQRTGRPMDVGVIGVALFREKQVWLPAPNVSYLRSDAESAGPASRAMPQAPAAAAPSPSPSSALASSPGLAGAQGKLESADAGAAKERRAASKLGTGHGERESSVVSQTAFERAQTAPNEIIRIRYDSTENLIAFGVLPSPRYAPQRPNPFPESLQGFVPDPPQVR